MSRLNDTRALQDMGCPGTDHGSLPNSGRAVVADMGWDMVRIRPSRNAAPDAGGRSLSSAIGCLRGGIRQGE